VAALALFFGGVFLALAARRYGRRRVRRQKLAAGFTPVNRPRRARGQRPGARGVQDYQRAIRAQPANGFYVVMTLCFLVSVWTQSGATGAASVLAVDLAVVFPLGYLWWRRWG
jgi:hypothetical protein